MGRRRDNYSATPLGYAGSADAPHTQADIERFVAAIDFPLVPSPSEQHQPFRLSDDDVDRIALRVLDYLRTLMLANTGHEPMA